MPYEVQKAGKKYKVVKKDTGEMVPGGDHPSKSKAEAHMRALYANEPELEKAAGWEEGKHPRAANGEFGAGSGGGEETPSTIPQKASAALAAGKDLPPGALREAHRSAIESGDKENAALLGNYREAIGDKPLKTSGLTHPQYEKIKSDLENGEEVEPDDVLRAHAHAVESGDTQTAKDLHGYLHAMGLKPDLKPKGPKNMRKAAQSPNQAQIFIPLAKIDQERHQVWGYGAVEEPDVANEIMDYATSLPRFQKWSDAAYKRSQGKSLGNLRSMHSMTAAGRLISFKPQAEKKGIWIGAEVVDPAEWTKVEKGVYTGFSIGGDYANRWWDAGSGKTRYTADPIEISLVDAPCIPSATFQVLKVDGTMELRKFAGGPGGENLLKAEMPGSPEPAGEQDLGPIQWSEITVDKMPDPDLAMQVSPLNPPDGEDLAGRHRGVMELSSQIDELLQASGIGENLRKAVSDLVLEKAAGWDESKHPRGKGGEFGAGSTGRQAESGSKPAPKAEPAGGEAAPAPAAPKKSMTGPAIQPKPGSREDELKAQGWRSSGFGTTKVSGGAGKPIKVAHVSDNGNGTWTTMTATGIGYNPHNPDKLSEYTTTEHPSEEEARAHAEKHLAGGAPAGKPAAPEPEPKGLTESADEFAKAGNFKQYGDPGKDARHASVVTINDPGAEHHGEHLTLTGTRNPDGTPGTFSAKFHPTREAAEAHAQKHVGEAAPEPGTSEPSLSERMKAAGWSPEADKALLATGKPEIHSPGAGKQAPPSQGTPAQAEQAPAGKPGNPGYAENILKGREEDDESITPEEHKALAAHYQAGPDDEEHAWQHLAEAHEKENGMRVPSTAVTAMHEHYQKTGKVAPEPDENGVYTLRSSRVRGAGGEVAWNPSRGTHSTMYRGPDTPKGKPQWSVEQGSLGKPGGEHPDAGVQPKNYTSMQEARMAHLNHLYGEKPPVQKIAISRPKPLPALAKRGARPFEPEKIQVRRDPAPVPTQAPRLIKVTNPRPPAEPAEPRKVRVSTPKAIQEK